MQGHSSTSNTPEWGPMNLSLPSTSATRRKENLLILELDKTLCSFGKNALNSNCPTIPRPYLYEFLKSVQVYYEIMIWSSTTIDITMAKLETLNLVNNEFFEINFVMSRANMVTKYLRCCKRYKLVKPLKAIWEKFPKRFTKRNTIMVDNVPANFYFDALNGIPINAYQPLMHGVDDELIYLGNYLIYLANHSSDFSTEDHINYKEYKPPI